jgi:CheY-like chemotaxis protein
VQLSLERIGGLTVKLVGESPKALEAIYSFKPDMVLLDCLMPGMSGEDFATLPVVFLTVKAYWRTVDDLLALGAAGVVTKPFSAKTLPEELKAIWAALPDPGGTAA